MKLKGGFFFSLFPLRCFVGFNLDVGLLLLLGLGEMLVAGGGNLECGVCEGGGWFSELYWSGFPFPPPGDLPKPGIHLLHW